MARTISLRVSPSDAEQMLRAVWDANETVHFVHRWLRLTVLIKHEGMTVAAVVPMEEYRQLHPEKPTSLPKETILYELPSKLLTAYHRFLDKKFTTDLTADEEKELVQLDNRLNEADMATPLEQSIRTKTRKKHQQRMAVLNDILAKLRSLNNSP